MPDNITELQRIPYMIDLLKNMSPDSKIKTITIMKHLSCGMTESIIKNYIPEFIQTKGLYHAR